MAGYPAIFVLAPPQGKGTERATLFRRQVHSCCLHLKFRLRCLTRPPETSDRIMLFENPVEASAPPSFSCGFFFN